MASLIVPRAVEFRRCLYGLRNPSGDRDRFIQILRIDQVATVVPVFLQTVRQSPVAFHHEPEHWLRFATECSGEASSIDRSHAVVVSTPQIPRSNVPVRSRSMHFVSINEQHVFHG